MKWPFAQHIVSKLGVHLMPLFLLISKQSLISIQKHTCIDIKLVFLVNLHFSQLLNWIVISFGLTKSYSVSTNCLILCTHGIFSYFVEKAIRYFHVMVLKWKVPVFVLMWSSWNDQQAPAQDNFFSNKVLSYSKYLGFSEYTR